MTGAVPGGPGDRLPGGRNDGTSSDPSDGHQPIGDGLPEGAEWDAALDEALDQFDRSHDETPDGSTAGASSGRSNGAARSDDQLRSRQRLRSALTTMTGRMMSERAVRASEAAAAAASASAEAANAVATGQSELREHRQRSAFHWGFFGGFGVLIAYVSYLMLDTIRDTLILIAIACLLAIGLDPLVGLIT
ncbi:MAG: hypothetical protein ABWZ98_09300, partial [Nakamurella sp.]